jgi:hypothetical protein
LIGTCWPQTAHLSPSAFSRFFKLRTGKSLPRYLNELRVGRACRLLADEHVKIVDIALNAASKNLANFNRRFREITGLNPSDYRPPLQESPPERRGEARLGGCRTGEPPPPGRIGPSSFSCLPPVAAPPRVSPAHQDCSLAALG